MQAWQNDPVIGQPAAQPAPAPQPAPQPRAPGGLVVAPLPNPRKDEADRRAAAAEQRAAQTAAFNQQATEQRLAFEAERLRLAQEEAANKGSVASNPLGRPLTKAEEEVDKILGQQYADWTTKGRADTQSLIEMLRGTIGTMEGTDRVSGPVVGALPDFANAWVNPEAIFVRQQIQEVAARNLKDILGGQFAQKEGEELLKRTFNPSLEEGYNIRNVERLLGVLEAAAQAEESRAQYFEQYGTFAGWRGPTGADVIREANAQGDALFQDQQETPAPATARGAPPAPPSGGNGSRNPPPAFDFTGAGKTPTPIMRITAGGDTLTQRIPERRGLEAQYRALLFADRPQAEIIQFLRQNGVTDPNQIRTAQAQIAYRRRNPNVPRDQYDTSGIEMQVVPQTDFQEAVTGGLEALGPVGAGLIAGADSLLTQNTARFASDPEGFREALGTLREENPVSTTIGDIVGGTLGVLGVGKLAGAAGLGARAAPIAAETAFGGATGYGVGGEDAGVLDVATGAALGYGGARLGNTVAGAMTDVAVPQGGSAAARAMEARGVRNMTPGQRFAESGRLGKLVNIAEQTAETIPIVGRAVRGARERPLEDFQRVTMGEVLSPIGVKVPPDAKLGPALFRYANAKIDDAFRRSEAGMTFEADNAFKQERSMFEADLASNQNLGDRERAVVNRIISDNFDARLDPTGNGNFVSLKGNDLATALQTMEREAGKASRRVQEQVLDFTDMVRSAAARNPNTSPDALRLFEQARESYSLLSVVSNAAAKDATANSRFTPSQLLQATRDTDTTSMKRRFLSGEARLQDTAVAGQTLESPVFHGKPVGRIAASGGGSLGLGLLGYFNPAMATMISAPAAAYLPGARNVLAGLVRPRHSAGTRKAARQFKNRSRPTTGAAGAAIAASQMED